VVASFLVIEFCMCVCGCVGVVNMVAVN
jgi:hypothetical protein